MRVFLTGATGFIGSRIVTELLSAGHQVIGLTRSEAGARALAEAGAEPHRGDIENPGSLQAGAAKADSVIHTAFDHDFTNFVANCEKDKRAIEALGAELKGSRRPFLITSGTGVGAEAPGQPALESVFNAAHQNPRVISEITGARLLDDGTDVRIVRLPQVHDTVKQGLVTPYIAISREKGVAAYIGEGLNRWPAAHVRDVAALYRLALERGQAGERYHAVDEEGVTAQEIATVIGAGLGVDVISLPPELAQQHFGWLGMFIGMDLVASSAWTRSRLGWQPTGPGIISDLTKMDYTKI
ncbi:nucleoside-diphosphate-sugar epimerase [Acetobacter nitrogenifigens DSM 23921 = NBRC 105050]|uniref:NAD-dependent dehydratase n=1 Tax=Acetobacter nitrogenifigens DSM 23921 = NBRC 105050 TaxID=1120919 RepID=A0A511XCZ9_9PROT|nr:SDR family oxidoreductase [Acetobacter nitrogenifigens]GBQ91599.1 nucleoside-diphosphate-sugar epimerase [Acetobacter nitrogenifigens DSM 23921 = NBRC 105050]GEN60820.1 NAD-dependent dehydratase [Acetobacter nitrogenifigens DSM 23921 = NBRC 105050]